MLTTRNYALSVSIECDNGHPFLTILTKNGLPKNPNDVFKSFKSQNRFSNQLIDIKFEYIIITISLYFQFY